MKNNINLNGKFHKNGASKMKDDDRTSPWEWLFSNFGVIMIVLFGILPFGLYKAWGTGVEWVPIVSFVLIGTVSTIAGVRNYKRLVRMRYIKRFWE